MFDCLLACFFNEWWQVVLINNLLQTEEDEYKRRQTRQGEYEHQLSD